jgi:hypothetical protein
VRERLRYPSFAEALRVALDPQRDLDLVIGGRVVQQQRTRGWFMEDRHVRHALQRVARHLDRDTLGPSDYATGRDALLASLRRRRGGELVDLPTFGQVLYATGWANALRLAGLGSPPLEETHADQLGVPVEDAIEMCLHAHGALPTRNDLLRFRRTNGFRMADTRPPYAAYVEALTERRRAQGLWTPPGYPPFGGRPDYTQLVAGLCAPPGRRYRWDDEAELLEAMIAFLDWIGPRRQPTKLTYAEYHRKHPGTPSESIWRQHGGWRAIRDRAQRERLERRSTRTAADPSS